MPNCRICGKPATDPPAYVVSFVCKHCHQHPTQGDAPDHRGCLMKTTDALIQLLTDAATLERSAAVRLGHRLHESDSSLIHTQTRADYAENLLAQAKDLVDYLESKTSAPA